MATLTSTRSYDDGEVLVRADLDAFLDDIETFLNVTKINDDNIQNSGITGSTKLLNQSVTEAKLASSAVSTLKIADEAVTTAKIADENVTTEKLAEDSVTADILADHASIDANRAVTTNHIRDLAVTTAKINTDAVTTVKILDLNVTTGKINDSAVTTIKINDGAVTPAKKSANYVSDTLTASRATNGTTYALGTSYTTSGRPIRITIWDGSYSLTHSTRLDVVRYDGVSHTVVGELIIQNNSSTTTGEFNGGLVSEEQFSDEGKWRSVTIIDIPAADDYQYGVRLFVNGSGTVSVTGLKMLVEEI